MISQGKLDDVYTAYREDAAFSHLRAGQNRLVPGEGGKSAVMIIGEAPGAHEAMALRPFVGPSGVILRQLMASANLFTSDSVGWLANCWLTNVIKYRPPRNRTPTRAEIWDSRPYLRAEHKAIGRPNVIVPVGGVALWAVMGQQRSILDAAGHKLIMQGRKGTWYHVWPMLHPSYGLRNPDARPEMETHWASFGEWLSNA